MTSEEKIIEQLSARFPFLEGQLYSPFEKRIFSAALDRADFENVVTFLHDEGGFLRAHHVVGVDDGEYLGFVYLFSNSEHIILALKEKAPRSAPVISSMNGLYPSLLIHELELVDLFGAQIEGLPDAPGYPLPDGWPQGSYPLRKDWNPAYFNKETMKYEPPKEEEGDAQ